MPRITDYAIDNRDTSETWLGVTVSVNPIELFKNALENANAARMTLVVDALVKYVDEVNQADGKESIRDFTRFLDEEGLT